MNCTSAGFSRKFVQTGASAKAPEGKISPPISGQSV